MTKRDLYCAHAIIRITSLSHFSNVQPDQRPVELAVSNAGKGIILPAVVVKLGQHLAANACTSGWGAEFSLCNAKGTVRQPGRQQHCQTSAGGVIWILVQRYDLAVIFG